MCAAMVAALAAARVVLSKKRVLSSIIRLSSLSRLALAEGAVERMKKWAATALRRY